jgi:hypothetical protein
MEKGAMLLPVGAPMPLPEVRALFPTGFEFQQEGLRVAGSPIGSVAFMTSFVQSKVAEAANKLSAIKLLAARAAQQPAATNYSGLSALQCPQT